ncbi:MAG: LysR family transcriptional regulator [Streptosporangiaceae bacterium]
MSRVSGIDLNLLVMFDALLEERNLTKAAAKLNLGQSTMSGALARLRRHFGDELMVRSGRQYLLTPEAERLLPAVREALRQAERAFTETSDFDPKTSVRTFSVAIAGHSLVALSGLLRRVHQLAPAVRLKLRPIDRDLIGGDEGLLQHDVLIAPVGFYSVRGRPDVICRDRLVCIADPANPYLRHGQLSLAELATMPHAAAELPHVEANPVRAVLEREGIAPTVAMATSGWLPIPFLVAGTDMVALIPERLARRTADAARVVVIEPPFADTELVEGAWWHPMCATDPALTWLRGVVCEAAES